MQFESLEIHSICLLIYLLTINDLLVSTGMWNRVSDAQGCPSELYYARDSRSSKLYQGMAQSLAAAFKIFPGSPLSDGLLIMFLRTLSALNGK